MYVSVFSCLVDISVVHEVADFSFILSKCNHHSDLTIGVELCCTCFHKGKSSKHRSDIMCVLYQIGDFIIQETREGQQEGHNLKGVTQAPFRNVILCCVFETEIGEHMPVNCGMAAGHTDAVSEKTAKFLKNLDPRLLW